MSSIGKEPFEPVPWSDAPLPRLAGPFAPNAALALAEHLRWPGILGPESIASSDNQPATLYVSSAVGAVFQLHAQDPSLPASPVFFTPAAVDGWRGAPGAHPLFAWCCQQAEARNASAMERCGRPLGLRIHSSTLLVADAYFGIFAVNVSAAARQLWSKTAPPPVWLVQPQAASPPLYFVNDLDVDPATNQARRGGTTAYYHYIMHACGCA